MVEGTIVPISKILQVLEEHKTEIERGAIVIQSKVNTIIKFKDRKPPFTDAEIKSVLCLTCYGNPAYCCGLQKTCIWRDAVLNILHITAEEYVYEKNICQMRLLKGRLEEKK